MQLHFLFELKQTFFLNHFSAPWCKKGPRKLDEYISNDHNKYCEYDSQKYVDEHIFHTG